MEQEIRECVFEAIDGYCSCVRGGCGRKIRQRRSDFDCATLRAVCRGTGPNTIQKAVNFAKAAAEHVATGLQLVDDAEVARRFGICIECELYKKVTEESGYCTHGKCGCNVKNNADDFMNKARWAEQQCPHPKGNKWSMTDEQLAECGHPGKPKETL